MPYEVTIGIPVYNVEKYIRLTMDSALAQTFDNIEFLILDDCGTDKSMEIVRDYQQKHPRGNNIRIVRQPQNMGIGNGRNRIIEDTRAVLPMTRQIDTYAFNDLPGGSVVGDGGDGTIILTVSSGV